ncbi:unnamed protein product, partial [Dibothriocephalus latus]
MTSSNPTRFCNRKCEEHRRRSGARYVVDALIFTKRDADQLFGVDLASGRSVYVPHFRILSTADQFRSHKLSAKASRQLQDVFSVLAGNLPDWLVQLMSTCPFLFPFSIRQTFFYVHNFDRERTILHLQDSTTNGGSDSDTSLLSPSTSSSPFGNLVAAPSFSGFNSHQLPLSVPPGSALQLL